MLCASRYHACIVQRLHGCSALVRRPAIRHLTAVMFMNVTVLVSAMPAATAVTVDVAAVVVRAPMVVVMVTAAAPTMPLLTGRKARTPGVLCNVAVRHAPLSCVPHITARLTEQVNWHNIQ